MRNSKSTKHLKFGIDIDYESSDWYDCDIFTDSCDEPADFWLTFDRERGILYGTPREANIGEYSVSITVDDNLNDSIPPTFLETFTINVSMHPSEIQF